MRVGCGVVGAVAARQIVQKQHRVGAFNRGPSPFNTDFLDCIQALAQARGVHHMDWHAFDLNGLLDLIACRTSDRRHDGQLGPGQGVEQRGLAGVGLAGNHHLNAFAQQRALSGLLFQGLQGGLQARELALGVGLLQKVDFFFRKVQRGFDQHAQTH